MITKLLATTAILGVLALTGYEYLQAIELQAQFASFVNKGPRFTAHDGQVLCERVQALEAQSYDSKAAGKTPLPCDYEARK